jgi:hypothetical protein
MSINGNNLYCRVYLYYMDLLGRKKPSGLKIGW